MLKPAIAAGAGIDTAVAVCPSAQKTVPPPPVTVTVAAAVAVPHCIVKVVVLVKVPEEIDPEVVPGKEGIAVCPSDPGEEHDVAPEEDQVRVEDDPDEMEVGLADRDATGVLVLIK